MKNGDTSYKNENSKKISNYLTSIPKNADVASSNNLGAQLSHRRNIYTVPHGLEFASFIALYNEKDAILDKIDITKYDTIISDDEVNFYLFKKKFALTCLNCNP